MSHIDRRSQYSLKVMRQALFELLKEKKLEEITVVDICKMADVNRGTFYKYYRDVFDLYDKTEDSLVEEIYALTNTDESGIQNKFFLKKILEILASNEEFSYIAQNKDYSERLAKKLLTYFVPYLRQMFQTKCPQASINEIDLLLEYVLGGCSRVVSYWLKNNMQLSIEEIDKKLTKMIEYTLLIYK